jgi:predicted ATPase
MKIKNITLTNFKRISNAVVPTLECNNDLNVLVGANNSGKTSILDAIADLFKIKNIYWERCLAYHLNGDGTLAVKANILFNRNEWTALIKIFGSTDEKYHALLAENILPKLENLPIEVFQSHNVKDGKLLRSERQSSLTPDCNLEVELAGVLGDAKQSLLGLIQQMAHNDFYNAYNRPIDLSPSTFVITNEPFIAERAVINDRTPTSHIPAKLYYVKQNDKEKFEKIRKEILQVFPEIKNFDITLNTKDGTFDFVLHEDIRTNGKTIEVPYGVADVGMGMQNLLVIVANILLLEPSVVLMDEPDAHMHPALVKNFIEIIKKLSGKTQFIIATHNVTLIEAVELSKIFHLNYKQEQKGTIIRNIQHPNELLRTVESLGYTVSNLQYATQPNLFVFCEGKSDKDYIFGFAKRFGKAKEINEFTTVFIPMGGKGERFKLARLIETLNKVYLDRAVLMLLDRDEGTEKQIDEFRNQYFKENPKRLFYLNKRQIENYLIDGDAFRKISKEKIEDARLLDLFNAIDLNNKLQELANEQQEKILQNYIEEKFINHSVIATKDLRQILSDIKLKPLNESVRKFTREMFGLLGEKVSDLSSATKTIVDLFNSDWNNPAKRLDMCDGRELLKAVGRWLQDDFKISFSGTELVDAMVTIPQDIIDLIEQLCKPEELKIAHK